MGTQQWRLYQIHEWLADGKLVPSAVLRERLGVSAATLKRDIRVLRNEYRAPIQYVRGARNGYRYDPKAPPFELAWEGIGPDDAARLALVLAAVDSIESATIRPLVDRLAARLRQTMRRAGLPEGDRLQVFAGRPLGRRAVDQRIFLTIVEALRRDRCLDLDYHARSTDQTGRRRVDPARLVFHRDNWYLIGWCRDRRAIRVFACDRILSAAPAGPLVHRLGPDDLSRVFATNFGMFIVGDDVPVQQAVLRFTPDRARWVRDEQWHPEQQGRGLPDGGWELRVPYREPTELILEILRHGDQVEVVEPAELRDQVAAILQRAAAIY